MMQDPTGADRVVSTKRGHQEAFVRQKAEHDKREKKTARPSHSALEPSRDQPLPVSSSRSGATREDGDVQHRQERNGRVNQHDVGMSKTTGKIKDQWKRRATPLSQGAERDETLKTTTEMINHQR